MYRSVSYETSCGTKFVHIDVMTGTTGETSGVLQLPLQFRGGRIDQEGLGTRVVLARRRQEVGLGENDVRGPPELMEGAGHGTAKGCRILSLPLASLRVRVAATAGGGNASEEGGAHQAPAGPLTNDAELVRDLLQTGSGGSWRHQSGSQHRG